MFSRFGNAGVFAGNSAANSVPTDDPANPNDARSVGGFVGADAIIDAAAPLRLWVDTSAGDVTLTLDMVVEQKIDLHNVGSNRVILVADPAFANGETTAYLTANGDHVEIIRGSAAYYAA